MRVHYLTMSFPFPGETFAGSDVRALLEEGIQVEVHSLRPRHPETDELVRQWNLAPVRLSHGGADDAVAGVIVALRRPLLLRDALRLAFSTVSFSTVSLTTVPPSTSRLSMFFKSLALLPRALTIFERLERERPDVLHLFWGHYPSLVARLVQERLPGVATSLFLGAYDLDWSYPLSRPAALAADVVWTHSRANLADLRQLGVDEERIRVAYRGLDLSRIPAPAAKTPGRIVTVGRLIASKGMDNVLRTFSEVAATHSNATLVIAGDGPERPRLEQLAGRLRVADRVEFLGRVEHRRVLAELNLAEVMLFLSEKPSERLPNAVKEAMACGCYCVAYATPGMNELIPDENHGAVTASSDPQVVAALVRRALNDSELRVRVGELARKFVRDNFDNRVTMRRYIDEWRRISRTDERQTVAEVPRDLVRGGGRA